MPKVTSVYYQRLETIPGRFANETYGCTVELGPNDTDEDAFLFAQESVASQHVAQRWNQSDWKRKFEHAKAELDILSENYRRIIAERDNYKKQLTAVARSLEVEGEIPF